MIVWRGLCVTVGILSSRRALGGILSGCIEEVVQMIVGIDMGHKDSKSMFVLAVNSFQVVCTLYL